MRQFRQLLDILEFDENRKGKVTSYLNLLRHLERLEQIGEYCTTFTVQQKLQNLVASGKTTPQDQLMYLAKYSECSATDADFENMFFLLMPFIQKDSKKLRTHSGETVLFPLGVLDK